MFYKKVLEEEYNQSQEAARSKVRNEMMGTLKLLQSTLMSLVKNNDMADDLEKLDRDEFVIDIKLKEAIIAEGEK